MVSRENTLVKLAVLLDFVRSMTLSTEICVSTHFGLFLSPSKYQSRSCRSSLLVKLTGGYADNSIEIGSNQPTLLAFMKTY